MKLFIGLNTDFNKSGNLNGRTLYHSHLYDKPLIPGKSACYYLLKQDNLLPLLIIKYR